MDSLKCQTSTASPAEPGDLLCWFSREGVQAALVVMLGHANERQTIEIGQAREIRVD